MATGQENQAAAAEKLAMGNPPSYSPPSQEPLLQETTPQKEHAQQFAKNNPQGFVHQQQPYPPQTAGYSDISGGYDYNQPMPQDIPRASGQMTSTQSTVMVNQPQLSPDMVVRNQAPYSYMAPAILSCIFCCCPLGIIAIVNAANSRSEAAEMKYDKARRSAITARSFTIAAVLCGILIILIGSIGQGNQAAAAEKVAMENPPPYSPPPQQPLQQKPTPEREHVQQFVQHNPQGFVQQQQPYQSQTAGFSDISGGYGYNQQMPPGQMTSTQSTVIVNQPQFAPGMVVINQAPYNYLAPAILSCLFCCWPLGIAAIVSAFNSQHKAAEMKYGEARRSAYSARSLAIASFVCGIFMYITSIAIYTTHTFL